MKKTLDRCYGLTIFFVENLAMDNVVFALDIADVDSMVDKRSNSNSDKDSRLVDSVDLATASNRMLFVDISVAVAVVSVGFVDMMVALVDFYNQVL